MWRTACVLFLGAACSTSPQETTAQGGNGGISPVGGQGGMAGAGGQPPSPPPMFETTIVPLLQSSCGAGLRDCHSRQVYVPDAADGCRGRMTFENVSLGSTFPFGSPNAGQPTGCPDRGLLERLLELEVSQCAQPTRYIVPCDTASSYVARKIDGDMLCFSGGELTSPMPPGTPLTTKQYDDMMRWIADGAPSLTMPSACP